MTIDEFNVRFPVGSPVRYFPVAGDGRFVSTKTRTTAWTLPGGIGVVMIEGKTGGVSIAHVAGDGVLEAHPGQETPA